LRYVLFSEFPGDGDSPMYVDRDEAIAAAEHHGMRVACVVYEPTRAFEITRAGITDARWENEATA